MLTTASGACVTEQRGGSPDLERRPVERIVRMLRRPRVAEFPAAATTARFDVLWTVHSRNADRRQAISPLLVTT